MSPVSPHQGGRSSVGKEGVWAQNKMCRQCSGRVWGGEPSLPAPGCWPGAVQPPQHEWLQCWTHRPDLHRAELPCRAGTAGDSAKPDSSPQHPLFSNLQEFPCSLHAPSQGWQSWEVSPHWAEVWVPQLKSPAAPQPFLELIRPWVLKDSSWTEFKSGGKKKQAHAEFFQEKPPQAAVFKQFGAI